jgi:hypothetical protein
MSLVRSEIKELAKIWKYFVPPGRFRDIHSASQLPNKLPTLRYFQEKMRWEKERR